MIERISTLLVAILGVVILVLLVITLSNRYIMQHNFSKGLRALVQMFMPPRDLFIPLVEEDLNISEHNIMKEFTYENKYIGKHVIELLLERVPEDFYHRKRKLQLQMEFKFIIDGNIVLTKSYTDDYNPFIGKHGFGLTLGIYSCPEELPIKKYIRCRVELIKPDLELSKIGGATKIRIRKHSDL